MSTVYSALAAELRNVTIAVRARDCIAYLSSCGLPVACVQLFGLVTGALIGALLRFSWLMLVMVDLDNTIRADSSFAYAHR